MEYLSTLAKVPEMLFPLPWSGVVRYCFMTKLLEYFANTFVFNDIMIARKMLFVKFQCVYLDTQYVAKLKSILFQLRLVDFLSKFLILGITIFTSVWFITRKITVQNLKVSVNTSGPECCESNLCMMAMLDGYEMEFKKDFQTESSQRISLLS